MFCIVRCCRHNIRDTQRFYQIENFQRTLSVVVFMCARSVVAIAHFHLIYRNVIHSTVKHRRYENGKTYCFQFNFRDGRKDSADEKTPFNGFDILWRQSLEKDNLDALATAAAVDAYNLMCIESTREIEKRTTAETNLMANNTQINVWPLVFNDFSVFS